MNVEIGTEASIFLFWEYLFQIFGILSLQCALKLSLERKISGSRKERIDISAHIGWREIGGDGV
jgi:hypothetical protein